MSSNFCHSCGAELLEDAKFCSACGAEVSFKDKISGFTQRLKYQTKKAIDNFKDSIDSQISTYLMQFDRGEEVRIGGVRIPDNRRKGVKSAMKSFQNKYLNGDATKSAAYDDWIKDLPQRMEEHTCIVCFSKWDQYQLGDIVVCPHCDSGGHQSHIENWIKSKKYCPLCRNTVSFSEFIKIV